MTRKNDGSELSYWEIYGVKVRLLKGEDEFDISRKLSISFSEVKKIKEGTIGSDIVVSEKSPLITKENKIGIWMDYLSGKGKIYISRKWGCGIPYFYFLKRAKNNKEKVYLKYVELYKIKYNDSPSYKRCK